MLNIPEIRELWIKDEIDDEDLKKKLFQNTKRRRGGKR